MIFGIAFEGFSDVSVSRELATGTPNPNPPDSVPDDIRTLRGPVVERLRYKDLDKAATSTNDAFANDPLRIYLRETPDARKPSRILKKISKLAWIANCAYLLRTHVGATINHGDANVIVKPAPSTMPHPRPFDRLLGSIVAALIGSYQNLSSPEQKKRRKEFEEKVENVIKDTLGESAKDMIYVLLLASSPECQGQGYGTALLQAVNDWADMQGRAVFLFSSNIGNTAFYHSCGYIHVSEAVLGTDNPSWSKKPVMVPLMVREPQGKGTSEKGLMLLE